MNTTAQVSRRETTTARFGRVVTYSVTLDGVRFTAERMVGLDSNYTVSVHGEPFRFGVATIPGGRNVRSIFLAVAQGMRAEMGIQ
jgi:hypothetical protein